MEHLWWRGDEQKLTFVNDKIVDGCDDSSTLRQNEVLVEVAFSGYFFIRRAFFTSMFKNYEF